LAPLSPLLNLLFPFFLQYELRVEQSLVRWIMTAEDSLKIPIPGRLPMGDILRMMRELDDDADGTKKEVSGEAALAP
jgi:hypothetical protein